MNPLRWIVQNPKVNQVIGIGIYGLLCVVPYYIKDNIHRDIFDLLRHSATPYLFLWIVITFIAHKLYGPEELPPTWRIIYSIVGGLLILLTGYFMAHFHLFR